MCFSASASFAASGGLAAIGVASLQIAEKKQRMLALVPLLFAAQQALEGFQWLRLNAGSSDITLGYAYLFFALLLWPIYIPLMVFSLDEKRRNALRWILGIGIMVTLALCGVLLTEPLSVHVLNSCIHYEIYVPFGILGLFLYLVAVCGSLLISSKPMFQFFGLAGLLLFLLTLKLYFENFVSVWCFFAAILSGLIFFYLYASRSRMRYNQNNFILFFLRMKTDALLKHAAMVGLFAIFLYALCLLWRGTMTDPAVMQFHLLALKTAFPGFSGYDAVSIILGGIMSFVYGFVISAVFHGFHNNCVCGMKK